MLRVHLLSEPDAADRAILDECAGNRVSITTGEELPDPPDFQVLVGGRPGAERLDASPDLRWLVVPYAGIPAETRDLLLARPHLSVANLHHNAPATAEMAIALLLAAAKMVVPMDRELRLGRWSGRGKDNPALLLNGETALVLGFGAIGRRVARACRALGMETIAVRRSAARIETVEGTAVHPVPDLRALLPRARAIVVCVPLTEETRGMIGEAELALLPPRAVLVNVGRGAVVDEAALYGALESGHLHSAGIDVWYRYPGADGDPNDTPPAEHPFGELPNVVLSPHRGGWLPGVEAHRMRDLGALLRAIAREEDIPGRVDLAAGY